MEKTGTFFILLKTYVMNRDYIELLKEEEKKAKRDMWFFGIVIVWLV